MVSHRLRFVRALTLWMLLGAVALVVLDALSYERLFVVSFVGYLLVSELTAPVNRAATWRRRLRPLTLVGLLGFCYVVVTTLAAAWPGGL
jgi:uncharacterized membrane protein